MWHVPDGANCTIGINTGDGRNAGDGGHGGSSPSLRAVMGECLGTWQEVGYDVITSAGLCATSPNFYFRFCTQPARIATPPTLTMTMTTDDHPPPSQRRRTITVTRPPAYCQPVGTTFFIFTNNYLPSSSLALPVHMISSTMKTTVTCVQIIANTLHV